MLFTVIFLTFIALVIGFFILRHATEKVHGKVRGFRSLGVGLYADGHARGSFAATDFGPAAGSHAEVHGQVHHGFGKHDLTSVVTFADGSTHSRLHRKQNTSQARLVHRTADEYNAAVARSAAPVTTSTGR